MMLATLAPDCDSAGTVSVIVTVRDGEQEVDHWHVLPATVEAAVESLRVCGYSPAGPTMVRMVADAIVLEQMVARLEMRDADAPHRAPGYDA